MTEENYLAKRKAEYVQYPTIVYTDALQLRTGEHRVQQEAYFLSNEWTRRMLREGSVFDDDVPIQAGLDACLSKVKDLVDRLQSGIDPDTLSHNASVVAAIAYACKDYWRLVRVVQKSSGITPVDEDKKAKAIKTIKKLGLSREELMKLLESMG